MEHQKLEASRSMGTSGTHSDAQETIPKCLGHINMISTSCFADVLEAVESNDAAKEGLIINCECKFDKAGQAALTKLPKAFGLSTTLKRLYFSGIKCEEALVAKAFSAGLRNDRVTSLGFGTGTTSNNEEGLKHMCEAIRKRSTAFELHLNACSSKFNKMMLEASYLKYFSLWLENMIFPKIELPLKKILRGNLFYISLCKIHELEEKHCLELSRCVSLMPRLVKLDLTETPIPAAALRHLLGSLKKILESGRSNMLKDLYLKGSKMDDKMSFACIRLLASDKVSNLQLATMNDLSEAMVKNIIANIANTRNLERVQFSSRFSSGTKFTKFNLQQEHYFFHSPFQINLPVEAIG